MVVVVGIDLVVFCFCYLCDVCMCGVVEIGVVVFGWLLFFNCGGCGVGMVCVLDVGICVVIFVEVSVDLLSG